MEKKVKETKSKGLIFSYDRRIEELFFISGEKLYFNKESKTFDIDQNPYGEADPRPVTNLTFGAGSFEFDTVLDNVDYHYKISSKYKADNALYEFLKENDLSNLDIVHNNDRDVVYVEYEKQRLTRIKLIKFEEGVSKDFLTIYFDPKENFLIKYPQQRRVLNGMSFNDNKLVCQIPDDELVWELQIQPVILALLKRIVESNG
ncbi:hypothetical protein ACTJJ0_06600 [Chitinophaga sp. 22321]|uniref:Uncharacterized protein n=1 Tax=Chitinophaga hostae TaxID=2831022 RepID=A0ABS5IYM7_9BACT|nr:hypothetical protein [Chitinophaga hostae]MBS0028070.1 hypothetical protein [Chitinophaga hostae]